MAADVAACKMMPDSHLLLDQPLLKVPYELARKNFKTAQRTIEHEQKTLLSSLKTASSTASTSSSQAPTLASLESMITRAETLKRKLETLHAEEKTIHRHSKARIGHLSDLHEIDNAADVKYDNWSKTRLNRLLVDYLVRTGYGESARRLAAETGVEDLVDIDAFMQCHEIRTSLEQHKLNDCLAWCTENKQALRKMGSSLEYELRLQQYIELVRAAHASSDPSDFLGATTYARKNFAAAPNLASNLAAANLLVYRPNTILAPYADLYSPKRWEHLASIFLTTYESLLSLPSRPSLSIALSAGLSALKTPACHSTHLSSSSNVNTSSGTSVCPICSTELNELARNVPYAHHAQSNVEAEPVVLPNGRVYGRERLMAFQGKNPLVGGGRSENHVRDPTEPERVFDVMQVRKIYFS